VDICNTVQDLRKRNNNMNSVGRIVDLYHFSTFSGIGGLDLAAERAGFRTVGQCEWADYQTKVLEKHWPTIPRWRDIRDVTKESFYERTGLRTVNVISGGFPCQPFSIAGKQRGTADDRYLWPELFRVIQEIRPHWFVGENVTGIINMELDNALSDLESIGYTTQAFIIPACAVDAPHRRDRCAIVAHAYGDAGRSRRTEPEGQQRKAGVADGGKDVAHANGKRRGWSYRAQRMAEPIGSSKDVVHADGERCEKFKFTAVTGETETISRSDYEKHVSDTDDRGRAVRGNEGLPETKRAGRKRGNFGGRTAEHGSGERWPAEPGVGRVAYGVPNRVDRIKCLGNAVVPAQFYPIFKAIADIERSEGGTSNADT